MWLTFSKNRKRMWLRTHENSSSKFFIEKKKKKKKSISSNNIKKEFKITKRVKDPRELS
jgi:hypothetical protein